MATATLFTNQTPGASGSDASPGLDLGTTFWLDADGSCVGVQIYYGPNVPVGAVASLYVKDNATPLATSAAVSTGTTNAYNIVSFASPVALTANTAYVAAYHTPTHYVLTSGFFDTQLDSPTGGIHGAQSGSDPVGVSGETLRNGLVGTGASPAYPSGDSGAHSCYFVGPVMGEASTINAQMAAALGGAVATMVGGRRVHATLQATLGGLHATLTSYSNPLVPASRGSGGWWGYLAIVREAEDLRNDELSGPPESCPNDGEPLREGVGGVLHCSYDGYEWPRDGRPY